MVFAILHSGQGLRGTLDALIAFACADPRMKTGCLYRKMYAGKHRLGPKTRARIEEISSAAHLAYRRFLSEYIESGELLPGSPIDVWAAYLEQIQSKRNRF